MRVGGSAALAAARHRAGQALRTPAFGIVIIAPLVLAGAVGASAPIQQAPVRDPAVTPLAAVQVPGQDRAGASVVAVTKTPADFHIAASAVSSPPPAVVVNAPGSLKIPAMALSAYRNAERMMAAASPGCGVSWNLLAGIGRIESGHANGGATDSRGTPVSPIYGPALDGTLPGNEVIELSRSTERITYARAMGPMQFLPGTWARYASDGDGDGKANVQNLYDSTLAAARYLCSGGLNLRDSSQVMTAILRYNNSVAYARNVLSWAGGYATGVVPVDLPPITGPVPALGDTHLDRYEGLGPGMPVNATGLPANDPLALIPVMSRNDAGQLPTTNVPGFAPGQLLGPLPGPAAEAPAAAPAPAAPAPWTPPWLAPPPPPSCVVFCLNSTTPAPLAPPAPAPGPLAPPAPTPPDPLAVPAPQPGPVPPAAVPDTALAAPAPAPAVGPAPAPAEVPAPAAVPAPGPAPAPAAAPAPGPAPLGPPPGPAA